MALRLWHNVTILFCSASSTRKQSTRQSPQHPKPSNPKPSTKTPSAVLSLQPSSDGKQAYEKTGGLY
jgi:hypothetical protein